MEWEAGAQALVGFRAEHKMFPNYTDYHRTEVCRAHWDLQHDFGANDLLVFN